MSMTANYYGCFGPLTDRLCPCCPCLFYENRLKLHDWFLASIRGMGGGIFMLIITIVVLSEAENIRDNSQLTDLNGRLYFLLLYIFAGLIALLVLLTLYVTHQIVRSLWEITSLSSKSIWLKTLSVFIICGVMQLQFVGLTWIASKVYTTYSIIAVNDVTVIAGLKNENCHTRDGQIKLNPCSSNKGCGLCFGASFFVLLMHLDVIVFAFINIFAFDIKDFVRWGKETLPHPNIYKYKQHINYGKIHDLYNYRKILGIYISQLKKKKKKHGLIKCKGAQFLYYEDHPYNDSNNGKPNLKESTSAMQSYSQLEEKEKKGHGNPKGNNNSGSNIGKGRKTPEDVSSVDQTPSSNDPKTAKKPDSLASQNKLISSEHAPLFKYMSLKGQPPLFKSASHDYVPQAQPSTSTAKQNVPQNADTQVAARNQDIARMLEFPEQIEP
ncbi:hypothetical protein RFI_18591 [Reticulomyxa filosa]|uniref:Uncharacterized protein n=1 Tax=Reticulomyxa filosa TaxID=46433 RepID=X6MXV4_RETFI|nr:hypothetical protein RFI_18591 [Reticulomyxa filosa]|eukprot:ETO18671.1 hypothetical protein RFI_18591 [Reticulomyxa filosa]